MMTRLVTDQYLLCRIIFCLLFFFIQSAAAQEYKGSIAHLPMLAENEQKGAFIDLVKALDNAYAEGDFNIKVYPIDRSINNVIDGRADFHLPMIRNPYVSIEDLPYRFASENMGIVCFVIYSHKKKPITRDMLMKNQEIPIFPYRVVSKKPIHFPFPTDAMFGIEQSLRNVDRKRIDALIFAQEETDFVLRELNLKSIHRSLYECWDDVVLIPKGERGDAIDAVISKALKVLRNNGKLQELRKKIHVPYDNWQP